MYIHLLKTALKISNWTISGHGGMLIFWFKKSTTIHDRLALEMNWCLQGAQVPEWMTEGKTTLIPKTRLKEPPETTTDP